MAQMMWWMVQPADKMGFSGTNDVVYGTASDQAGPLWHK